MTMTVEGLHIRQRPTMLARELQSPLLERLQKMKEHGDAEARGPFRGITTDGSVAPGLFRIEQTGISTRPIAETAEALLAALSAEQRASVLFPVDSDVWRRWSNIHPYLMRHGVPLEEMTAGQRERALGLLEASLSASGYRTARNVMRLNYTIGEITGKWDEYGEWLYWLSVLGHPSADEPWGWQIDGHHLIVNCFVLGDQVVLTPLFMGSEPVYAPIGTYAGTRVFEAEEREGLAFMRTLDAAQRRQATIGEELPVELFTAAFRDNFELRYEGVRCDQLSGAQRERLVELIGIYVGRLRPGHAEIKLDEVKRHLDATHFGWIGGCEDDSVYYYRVHSPVILIEFDHQRGIALDSDVPTRTHIHTVVRTPNGNDYGKDLLRQHHARFDHSHPASAHH